MWFSTSSRPEEIQALSESVLGTAGVLRDGQGNPLALGIWRGGQLERRFGLEGVAPYHGLLGEKTLEELLAAVAAAWFGPLPVEDWDARLPALRLDSENHMFRTSVHKQGDTVFVLDKAGEEASLAILQDAIDQIANREAVEWRIAVMTRQASEPPKRHLQSARMLYHIADEFVCFDRPDTYAGASALPDYEPGSIPVLLRDELDRQNAEHETNKPVTVLPGWAETEDFLRKRLAELGGKTLVLVNQPSTSVHELNQSIIDFATGKADVADG